MFYPLFVGEGGDFAGFDFAASAPEDVGVADGDADFGEVGIDGGFVGEDTVFVGAVGDAHDVDVIEFGAAFAPVGMGHDMETADLATGLDFHALRDSPVEEGVVGGDALAGGVGFDVFEEGGKASDDAAGVEGVGDFEEFGEGNFRFGGAVKPEFVGGALGGGFEFFGGELAFEEMRTFHSRVVRWT